jgi:hypothetical protein
LRPPAGTGAQLDGHREARVPDALAKGRDHLVLELSAHPVDVGVLGQLHVEDGALAAAEDQFDRGGEPWGPAVIGFVRMKTAVRPAATRRQPERGTTKRWSWSAGSVNRA